MRSHGFLIESCDTGVFSSLCTGIAGYMLGNLPIEKSGLISKEHICEGMYIVLYNGASLLLYSHVVLVALTLLLRDPSPLVRASTAEAMSLLYEY